MTTEDHGSLIDSTEEMDTIMQQHPPGNRLTDDLLIEIFSRLPVKSLMRFKCASKAWYHLISDMLSGNRLFLTMSGLFYEVYTRDNLGFLQSKIEYINIHNDSITHPGLCFLPWLNNLRLHDCCNGLLLCSSSPNAEFLYICNPSTKKWVAIPRPRKPAFCLALAFDPRMSCHYTIVLFRSRWPKTSYLDTFSSETGKWIERDVCWGADAKHFCHRLRVFFNGVLHIVSSPCLVVCIDVKEMNCWNFELPETATVCGGCLGQSEGHLHYACMDDAQLQIWVLEDYSTNRWAMKHCCNVQALVEQQHIHDDLPSTSYVFCKFGALAFHPDYEVVFLQVLGKLCSYHLSSAKLEQICDLGPIRVPWFYPFSPCLQELLDWQGE